jgi:uncharacterized membrane protein
MLLSMYYVCMTKAQAKQRGQLICITCAPHMFNTSILTEIMLDLQKTMLEAF